MAIYATLPDLYDRFGEDEVNQITDTDETGTPDPDLIKKASTDAASEIDAALIARYKVPLAPVPPLVRRIACELVWELIHLQQGNCPKAVHELAENARRLLRDLATGILRLDVEAAEAGPVTSDARIITTKTRMEW